MTLTLVVAGADSLRGRRVTGGGPTVVTLSRVGGAPTVQRPGAPATAERREQVAAYGLTGAGKIGSRAVPGPESEGG